MTWISIIISLFFLSSCSVKQSKPVYNLSNDFEVKLSALIQSNNLRFLLEKSNDTDLFNSLKLKVEALLSEVNQTVLNLFPKSEIDFSVQNFDKSFNLSKSFVWNLDVFGVIRNIYASSYFKFESAKSDLEYLDRSIKSILAVSYLSYYYSSEQVKILYQGCNSLQKIAEIANKRFEAGLETKDQNFSARIDYLLCLDNLGKVNLEILNSLRTIHSFFGNQVHFDLYDEVIVNDQVKISCNFVDAIKSRPDIISAWNRFKAVLKTYDSSLAEFMPRISISGSFLKIGGSFAGLFPISAPGVISFALSQPVLDLPSIIFKARSLDKLKNAELHQLQHNIKEALAEIIWAFQVFELAKLRKDLLKNAINLAEEMFEVSLKRYEEGLSDLQTVLLQHERLTRLKTQKTLNDLALAVSLVNLIKSSPAIIIE